MKAMILSDLLTIRKYFKSQALLYMVVVVAISLFIENIYMIAPFLGVMMPFSLAFTLLAYAERNNWEQFRLVLPLSRKNIIAGRYASLAIVMVAGIVLGLVATGIVYAVAHFVPNIADALIADFDAQGLILSAAAPVGIIFIMLSITLPLIARFGMTKAIRYVPVFFLVIVMLVFTSGSIPGVDYGVFLPALNSLVAMLESLQGTLAVAGIVIAAGAIIYILSGMLSVRLYEKREF